MIRHIFLLFSLCCLFSFSLRGNEETLSPLPTQPCELQYEGKKIVFKGNVVIEHGLGQISAHRLAAYPTSNKDKKQEYGLIEMSEDVEIQLRNEGTVRCQHAQVSDVNMRGFFQGNDTYPYVIYSNMAKNTEHSASYVPSLEVKGREMEFFLKRADHSSKLFVDKIEAKRDISIHYRSHYFLTSDYAHYQFFPSSSPSLNGLLTLFMEENTAYCRLTNIHQDDFLARKISVNTFKKELTCQDVSGTLTLKHDTDSPQPLTFTADEVIWDEQADCLRLKGNIHVSYHTLFHFETPYDVIITQKTVDGKKTLHRIEALKEVDFFYCDPLTTKKRKVHCPGSFIFIYPERTLMFEMEKQEGAHQVFIEDAWGEMYADRIQLHYDWKNERLTPENLLLEGNVKLLNRFDGHTQETGSILQYALADKVEYALIKNEILLSSYGKERVLFFDKVNKLQMSAPSLKITYKIGEQHPIIQGIGDVRFTLIEKEFEQIKEQFRSKGLTHHKESSHGTP